MRKNGKISGIIKLLRKMYPQADIALKHKNPFQLLVATILSAQCTDARVNIVTPGLFAKYRGPADFANASRPELEKEIHSTGFYKNKAASIIESAKAIISEFGGKVPETMDELLQLRGVARKTANVVLGGAYGIAAGVVVDTHVKRLSFRLGLTNEPAPEKVEADLMKLIDKKDWIWFSHALILHGRSVCKALNPQCPSCKLNPLCPKRGAVC